MLEFTNCFHTLHMKLGIKDSERNLVLKCRVVYIDTPRMRWSCWTSPRSSQCIDTLSILSKNLNRISKTLDLLIRRKGKASQNHKEKDKVKVMMRLINR